MTHLREANLALRAIGKSIETPLEFNYWSMSAFRLGNQIVKYKFTPCKTPSFKAANKSEENYLREAMKKQLGEGDACFIMSAQFYVNDKKTPVEDSSVEWEESDSPMFQIATINIPKQTFDTPEQNQFCENLSFTPWHSLPEHRPLGNLNRARLQVYRAVSLKRHAVNQAPRLEPTPATVP